MAFLDELAHVAVTYRSEKEFAALKDAASSLASSLEGHEVDATDEATVGGLVAKILSERGRLDVLVNVVGA